MEHIPYRSPDAGSANALRGLFNPTHRLIETTSLDEARDLICQKISPHEISILENGDRLNVRYDGISSGVFALLNARMGADVRVKPLDTKSFFYAYTPIKGKARVYSRNEEVDLNELQTIVVSPENAYQMDVSGQSDRLVIGLEASSFHAYLEMLLLRTISEPLKFEMHPGDHATSQIWRSFAASIGAALFSAGDIASKQRVMKSFSEAAMAMALELFPHNYRDALHNQKMDLDTKRLNLALDYIHENLRETIALKDVANASGMSGRNLQLLFRKRYNQSPMEYFKAKKLEMIKQTLEHAPIGARVADIVGKFGIAPSGHFSALFKQKFGCTPSQAIGRAVAL